MKTIAMTGASGFIGGNLTNTFAGRGWQTLALDKDDFKLTPEALALKISQANVVVNLAGAPIISRWTDEYKKLMRQSRVDLTRKLVDAIALMPVRPEVLISTSAVGVYSPKGGHDERTFTLAGDFLGKLALDWEAEALRAESLGVRTVIYRFGIVIGRGGGVLAQMMEPFKMGVGGTIGDGSQAFSWVHMDDLRQAYISAVEDETLSGIYNLTAPNPTTNKGLTQALADALHRPAIFRVPEFALRLKYGEGASVLTSGQRVFPKRLIEHGFKFKYENIDDAVKASV